MIVYFIIAILAMYIIGEMTKGYIIFSPIFGVMFGMLYSYTDFDDGREHTIQCCLFILSITVIWNTTPNGSEL